MIDSPHHTAAYPFFYVFEGRSVGSPVPPIENIHRIIEDVAEIQILELPIVDVWRRALDPPALALVLGRADQGNDIFPAVDSAGGVEHCLIGECSNHELTSHSR